MKRKFPVRTMICIAAMLFMTVLPLCSCANRVFITFDANGGFFEGNETVVLTLEAGSAVKKPEEPTREGYRFAGWDSEITTAEKDTTIYATWEELDLFTVRFELNGGTAEGAELTQKLYAGSLPADFVPVREGYAFSGWDKEILPVTGDTVYTAVWNVPKYTVTFELCGGTSDDSTVVTVEEGESAPAPETRREGFVFAGWSEKTDNVKSDMTVKAIWNDGGKCKDRDAVFAKCAPSAVTILCERGEEQVQGSGFIISSDGLVVTCLHVVAGCEKIYVVLYDKRVFEVQSIVAYDGETDQAILKINASSLPALNTSESSKGDTVYSVTYKNSEWVIGEGTITDKDFDSGKGLCYVSTLALTGGCSGSALLSSYGTVVGINSAAAVDTSMTYSLDIEYLKTVGEAVSPSDFAAQTQRYIVYVSENEPNNAPDSARNIYLGQYVNGVLSPGDTDCYKCIDPSPVWYIYFDSAYEQTVKLDFSGAGEWEYGTFTNGGTKYSMYAVFGDGVITVTAGDNQTADITYTVAAAKD